MSMERTEDYRSLAVMALTLALMAFSIQCVPWSWAPVVVVVQTLLSFICCVINHNHTHRPMCSSERANTFVGVLLTLCRGHSSMIVIVPHNLNHHVHGGHEGDWSRPELAGSGWGLARVARYLWRSSLEMARRRREPSAPALPAKLQRRQRLEQIALRALIVFGLLFNWKAFLLFWAIPWFLAIEGLLTINLLQHDSFADSQPVSRNFVGAVTNWLFFNAGFHTSHHERPLLHWTELPRSHAELIRSGKTDPAWDEPSLIGFFFRHYVFAVPGSPQRISMESP
jgi:fatty acid desaturase